MAQPQQILFATSASHPNLTADDRLAVDALRARGYDARPLVWSDSDAAALRDAAALVVRSCWDYHLYPARFGRWIEAVARAGTPLFNAPAQLRWNLHKRYLLELQAAGVAIPPTRLVLRGESRALAEIGEALGAEDLVVKPAVSLSAHGTWRARAGDAADQQRYALQLQTSDLLVQAWLPEVVEGELSLLFFDGRYSHAVRKRPAAGDFRVQADFGGTHAPEDPPPTVRAAAEALVARHARGALYCRVDGVVTARGFVLMELELIDPVLFLAQHPAAAGAFADALLRRVSAAGTAPVALAQA